MCHIREEFSHSHHCTKLNSPVPIGWSRLQCPTVRTSWDPESQLTLRPNFIQPPNVLYCVPRSLIRHNSFAITTRTGIGPNSLFPLHSYKHSIAGIIHLFEWCRLCCNNWRWGSAYNFPLETRWPITMVTLSPLQLNTCFMDNGYARLLFTWFIK
jgi:hypothetical protein